MIVLFGKKGKNDNHHHQVVGVVVVIVFLGFFSAGLPGRREIIMEIIKVLCRGALPPEPPVPPASRPATPVQADLSAGRWPA